MKQSTSAASKFFRLDSQIPILVHPVWHNRSDPELMLKIENILQMLLRLSNEANDLPKQIKYFEQAVSFTSLLEAISPKSERIDQISNMYNELLECEDVKNNIILTELFDKVHKLKKRYLVISDKNATIRKRRGAILVSSANSDLVANETMFKRCAPQNSQDDVINLKEFESEENYAAIITILEKWLNSSKIEKKYSDAIYLSCAIENIQKQYIPNSGGARKNQDQLISDFIYYQFFVSKLFEQQYHEMFSNQMLNKHERALSILDALLMLANERFLFHQFTEAKDCFCKLLELIADLIPRFIQEAEGNIRLISLVQKAVDPLYQIYLAESKDCIIDLYRENNSESVTEIMRCELFAIREKFKHEIETNHCGYMQQILQNNNNLIENFIKKIIDLCIKRLGLPPCKYSIIFLGSSARKEPCPYSDIELFICIEEDKPNYIKYFLQFSSLLEKYILSLGETKSYLADILIKTPLGHGFSTDDGGNFPSEGTNLIGTAEVLIKNHFFLQNDIPANVITSLALLDARFFYGDKTLFDNFQDKVKTILDSVTANNKKLRENFALYLLSEDLNTFQPEKHNDQIHAKRDLTRLVIFGLSCLSLYYGLTKINSWDRITALESKKHIDIDFADFLRHVLNVGMQTRITVEFFYGEANDIIYSSKREDGKNAFIASSDNTMRRLRNLRETVLVAIFERLKGFKEFSAGDIATNPLKDIKNIKPVIANFWTDSGHEFIGHNDKKIECYEKALKLNPHDPIASKCLREARQYYLEEKKVLDYVCKQISILQEKLPIDFPSAAHNYINKKEYDAAMGIIDQYLIKALKVNFTSQNKQIFENEQILAKLLRILAKILWVIGDPEIIVHCFSLIASKKITDHNILKQAFIDCLQGDMRRKEWILDRIEQFPCGGYRPKLIMDGLLEIIKLGSNKTEESIALVNNYIIKFPPSLLSCTKNRNKLEHLGTGNLAGHFFSIKGYNQSFSILACNILLQGVIGSHLQFLFSYNDQKINQTNELIIFSKERLNIGANFNSINSLESYQFSFLLMTSLLMGCNISDPALNLFNATEEKSNLYLPIITDSFFNTASTSIEFKNILFLSDKLQTTLNASAVCEFLCFDWYNVFNDMLDKLKGYRSAIFQESPRENAAPQDESGIFSFYAGLIQDLMTRYHVLQRIFINNPRLPTGFELLGILAGNKVQDFYSDIMANNPLWENRVNFFNATLSFPVISREMNHPLTLPKLNSIPSQLHTLEDAGKIVLGIGRWLGNISEITNQLKKGEFHILQELDSIELKQKFLELLSWKQIPENMHADILKTLESSKYTSINLRGCQTSSALLFQFVKNNGKLKFLDLRSTKITDHDLALIGKHCTLLSELQLRGCKEVSHVKFKQNFPYLLRKIDFAKVSKQFIELVEKNYENNISSMDYSLNLSDVTLASYETEVLNLIIKAQPQLLMICLREVQCKSMKFNFTNLSKLKTLSLIDIGLSDEQLSDLLSTLHKASTHLRILNLARNVLSHKSMIDLGKFIISSKLNLIILDRSFKDCNAIKILLNTMQHELENSYKDTPMIEVLSLNYAPLGQDILPLIELLRLLSVKQLFLRNIDLRPDQYILLLESLSIFKLEVIDLSSNKLDDSCIETIILIARLPSLRRLAIKDNNFTNAGMIRMMQEISENSKDLQLDLDYHPVKQFNTKPTEDELTTINFFDFSLNRERARTRDEYTFNRAEMIVGEQKTTFIPVKQLNIEPSSRRKSAIGQQRISFINSSKREEPEYKNNSISVNLQIK